MAIGKCGECGYLWLSLKAFPFRAMAPDEYRKFGEFDEAISTGEPICDCSVPIRQTFVDLVDDMGRSPIEAAAEINRESRDCEFFEPWENGLNPKEQRTLVTRAMLKETNDRMNSMMWAGIVISAINAVVAILSPLVYHWIGIN